MRFGFRVGFCEPPHLAPAWLTLLSNANNLKSSNEMRNWTGIDGRPPCREFPERGALA